MFDFKTVQFKFGYVCYSQIVTPLAAKTAVTGTRYRPYKRCLVYRHKRPPHDHVVLATTRKWHTINKTKIKMPLFYFTYSFRIISNIV